MPDTSEKYIRMCRMSDEVQAGWLPGAGDWYADMTNDDLESRAKVVLLSQFSMDRDGGVTYVPFSHTTHFANSFADFRAYRYWLPSPTELEEFIIKQEEFIIKQAPGLKMKTRFNDWIAVQYNFYNYNIGGDYDDCHFEMSHINEHCKSIHQLWLCFVMEALYNKKWSDKSDGNRGGWVDV